MSSLLHELPDFSARKSPDALAIKHRSSSFTYGQLQSDIDSVSNALIHLGIGRQERVGIFLPKQYETIISIFATSAAGCVFVPINPILKAPQVEHILRDCSICILITTSERLSALDTSLNHCTDLNHVILIDDPKPLQVSAAGIKISHWQALFTETTIRAKHRVIDTDMAAILYTSGSTGKPKGVVLSHRNLVTGATSVAQYLENTHQDRLLAVLPLSFDYGLSQITTAFLVGASVVLMEYLFPKDIIRTVSEQKITGLAGVPPLWFQLADLEWPTQAKNSLRYFTNSGGTLPLGTLNKLRASLPDSKPFLMYGLTEAFRSTYLPPEDIDLRPNSIGKAIPNVGISVVRPDSSLCNSDEPGELVHHGSLVALGYWNDPKKTAERFRAAPNQNKALPFSEIAVWSGDTVKMDAQGYLYFLGRSDEMIKTSGYRVSPNEIEEVILGTGLVSEAVVMGIPNQALGQAIVAIVIAGKNIAEDANALLAACKESLPAFMTPSRIEFRKSLPRNQNGKYDRALLSAELVRLNIEQPT